MFGSLLPLALEFLQSARVLRTLLLKLLLDCGEFLAEFPLALIERLALVGGLDLCLGSDGFQLRVQRLARLHVRMQNGVRGGIERLAGLRHLLVEGRFEPGKGIVDLLPPCRAGIRRGFGDPPDLCFRTIDFRRQLLFDIRRKVILPLDAGLKVIERIVHRLLLTRKSLLPLLRRECELRPKGFRLGG